MTQGEIMAYNNGLLVGMASKGLIIAGGSIGGSGVLDPPVVIPDDRAIFKYQNWTDAMRATYIEYPYYAMFRACLWERNEYINTVAFNRVPFYYFYKGRYDNRHDIFIDEATVGMSTDRYRQNNVYMELNGTFARGLYSDVQTMQWGSVTDKDTGSEYRGLGIRAEPVNMLYSNGIIILNVDKPVSLTISEFPQKFGDEIYKYGTWTDKMKSVYQTHPYYLMGLFDWYGDQRHFIAFNSRPFVYHVSVVNGVSYEEYYYPNYGDTVGQNLVFIDTSNGYQPVACNYWCAGSGCGLVSNRQGSSGLQYSNGVENKNTTEFPYPLA